MRELGVGDAAADELAALIVRGRRGFAEGTPLRDFPVAALVLLIFLDPGQQLAIALVFGDFSLEGFGIDAGKRKQTLVQGTVVVVRAVLAGEFGAALVDHAG